MSAVARADKIRDFLLYFLMDPTEEVCFIPPKNDISNSESESL